MAFRPNAWFSIVMICFLFCAGSAAAADRSGGKIVRVGFVVAIPPFVMGESGILVDLVREGFARSGFTMKMYHFPSKQFDSDPLNSFRELDLFVGTPASLRGDYTYYQIFQFDNVAVSKETANLRIDRVSDLAQKQIVAFNNAGLHLKEPFTGFYEKHLKSWPGYIEVENQKSQFAMLMNDRTQVILLDRYMVYYYAKLYGIRNSEGLVFHEIFPVKNEIYAVGRDKRWTRHLEKHLPIMRAEGWIDAMLRKYK